MDCGIMRFIACYNVRVSCLKLRLCCFGRLYITVGSHVWLIYDWKVVVLFFCHCSPLIYYVHHCQHAHLQLHLKSMAEGKIWPFRIKTPSTDCKKKFGAVVYVRDTNPGIKFCAKPFPRLLALLNGWMIMRFLIIIIILLLLLLLLIFLFLLFILHSL